MARQKSGPRRRRRSRSRDNRHAGFGLGPRPGVEVRPLDPLPEEDEQEPLHVSPETISASIKQAIEEGEFSSNQLAELSHIDIPGLKEDNRGVFDREVMNELGLKPPPEAFPPGPDTAQTGGGFLVPPEMRNRISPEPVLARPDNYLLNIQERRKETPEEIEALLRGDIDPRADSGTAMAEWLPNGGVPLSDLSLEAAARDAMEQGVQALGVQNANAARHANARQLPPEEHARLSEAYSHDVQPPPPTRHVNDIGTGPDPALAEIAALEDLRNTVPPQNAARHALPAPGGSGRLSPAQIDQITNSAPATQRAAFLNRPNATPPLTGNPVADRAAKLAQA